MALGKEKDTGMGAKQAKQSTLNHVHPVIICWIGGLKEHKDLVSSINYICICNVYLINNNPYLGITLLLSKGGNMYQNRFK